MALPERKLEGIVVSLAGSLLPLTFLAADPLVPLAGLTTLVMAAGLLCLFRIGDIRDSAREAALLVSGFAYVPLLLSHLVLLRSMANGVSWILLVILIVMAGDTFAFYTGSTIGRRKLYPVVSPNKSVEGALGGLAGSVAGAFIARATFFPQLTAVDALATALLLGVLGQLGDLFESLLKRSFGVKDSGVIVPGHGGILDRLDSVLFAAPAAFFYAYFVVAGR